MHSFERHPLVVGRTAMIKDKDFASPFSRLEPPRLLESEKAYICFDLLSICPH